MDSSRQRLLVALAANAAFALCACSTSADLGRGDQSVQLPDFDWDNPVNLTQNSYWDFDPDYSPDGSKIAFHSNRPPSPKNRGQIYVMNADGSDQRALTNTEGTNYGAVWSPDGSQIAFTSERDGNPDVYVMNADGSAQTNLSRSPDSYDAGPDWSPDGRYLAYFSGAQRPQSDEYQPSGSPYRYWNADLFILDMKTGARTRVTDSDMDDVYPSWSPDGQMLAFTSSRAGNNELYVVNIDGSDLRRITNNTFDDNAPTWMPDGNQIKYRGGPKYAQDNPDPDADQSNIYVANLAGGQVTRVTRRPGTVYFDATIAPNQNSAIYSAFTMNESAFRGELAEIYVVRRRE